MAARLKQLGYLTNLVPKYPNLRIQSRLWIHLHQNRCFHLSRYCLGAAMKIKMPALSPTMEQGTIVQWYKKEGEPVAAGDILCDIQTDKAVVSFEIEDEGVLAKILHPGDTKDLKVGTVIALMVEEGEDWQNVEVPTDTAEPDAAAAPSAPPAVEAVSAPPGVQPATHDAARHGYGPAVRSLLDLYQINTSDVVATGPHGRLLKGDLLKHIRDKGLKPAPITPVAPPTAAKPLTPAAPAPPPPTAVPAAAPAAAPVSYPTPVSVETEGYVDIELTNMRKTIAKRLTESKTTIPHAYATADCNIGELQKTRKQLAADGVKVSVNDFIIKASAVALQRVPEANALWGGEAPRVLKDIDISVAVATDSGLITPIVKDAISKGLQDISADVKDLATRARANKLQLHEFQGGSFTISNLGMFGISEFSAVINPPQAAILAIGTNRIKLDLEGQPQTMMKVTLSSDARIIDDMLAAKFLEVFKEVIENPMLMLSQGTQVDLQKLFAK